MKNKAMTQIVKEYFDLSADHWNDEALNMVRENPEYKEEKQPFITDLGERLSYEVESIIRNGLLDDISPLYTDMLMEAIYLTDFEEIAREIIEDAKDSIEKVEKWSAVF